MTKLQKQYETYNSSWGKFLFCYALPEIPLCGYMLIVAYHIHNLYSQYQYNKSLEHEIKVEINGIEETVKASPQYFDWYTSYNVVGIVVVASTIKLLQDRQNFNNVLNNAMGAGDHSLENIRSAYLRVSTEPSVVNARSHVIKSSNRTFLLFAILGIFKLISLKDTYLDFQYTDSKGNIISPEIVESGFIGYIDDSRDNEAIEVTQDDLITIDCDNSFTVIFHHLNS